MESRAWAFVAVYQVGLQRTNLEQQQKQQQWKLCLRKQNSNLKRYRIQASRLQTFISIS